MTIRPYTPADYVKLVAIDQIIYPNVPRHVQNYVERDNTLEAKNPDIAFKRWVYELDGQIVGYAKAQVQKVWQRTSCEINAGETRLWFTLNSWIAT